LLDQMRIVYRMLDRVGWKRYEISNFAKPGHESVHNQNYWRYGEYLGVGAGATSFVKTSGDNFARRWTQARDIDAFLKGDHLLVDDENIDRKTAMGEFMFMGLRTTEGIDTHTFKRTFGESFESHYGELKKRFEAEDLLKLEGNSMKLTPKGVELSNLVFAGFVCN